MEKKSYEIYSKILDRPIEIIVYGHYGASLLLFPTITDDPYENEKAGIIDNLCEFIEKGKLRIFSIPTINFQTWLKDDISNEERSELHRKYNEFIEDELVPFIFSLTDGPSPIITAGAAIGAFHAANTYFRRPDIFYGTIALSGTYDIMHYTKGYFDSNCYFNSPIHYLSNLEHPYWLSSLRSKHHVYILSGSGNDEYPDNSINLSNILKNKGIKHYLDIWSNEYHHSYDTWSLMLKHILDTKL